MDTTLTPNRQVDLSFGTKPSDGRRYRIDVHSTGYEDFTIYVYARTLAQAKRFELRAKVEWCELNAVDVDTCDLPFTRTFHCPL